MLIRLRKDIPLHILLFLIAIQGYIELFLFKAGRPETVAWLQYRPLTWGFFVVAFIWMIIGLSIASVKHSAMKRSLNYLVPLMATYSFVIIFWGYLGFKNGNIDAVFDIRAFIEILAVIIMAATTCGDSSRVNKSIIVFCNSTLLLAVFVIIFNIPMCLGMNSRHELGRYLLVLLFPYCIFFSRMLLSKERKKPNLIKVLIITFAFVITFRKYMLFTSLCSTLFIIYFVTLKQKMKRARTILYISLLITLNFTIIIGVNLFTHGYFSSFVSAKILTRFLKTNASGTTSVEEALRYREWGDLSGGRFEIWEYAIAMFKGNMLIGNGIGVNIPTIWGPVQIHNIFIYFLTCLGVVGTVLMIGIIFSCLKKLIDGLKIDKDIEIKIGLLGFIFGILCFNMVGIFFSFYAARFLFAICLGILLKGGVLTSSLKQA